MSTTHLSGGVILSFLSTFLSGLSMITFVAFVEDWSWTGLTTVNYYKSHWFPPLISFSPFLNNTLVMAIFALQHSTMARKGIRALIGTTILRVQDDLYPSIYALMASLSLLILTQFWIPINNFYIWSLDSNAILWYALQVTSTICWLLAGVAVMSIDRFQLCGGEHFIEFLFGKSNVQKWLPKPEGLITTGIYSFVRHPAMCFMILGICVSPVMSLGHLYLSIFLTLYIMFAVHYFEEPQLMSVFGETYKQYIKKVPYQVLPWIK